MSRLRAKLESRAGTAAFSRPCAASATSCYEIDRCAAGAVVRPAATVTLACLFVVGYYLLENHLIHGLDLLNRAEFEQITRHLGPTTRRSEPR